MNRLDEIRKRHEATLFIDWEKEFDPEWQPQSLSNAELAHKDRGALLDMVKELEDIVGIDAVRITAFERREKELEEKLAKAIEWIQHDCPWDEKTIRENLEATIKR